MDIQLIKNEFSKFTKFYKERNLKLAFLCLDKILKENPNQTEAIFFQEYFMFKLKILKKLKIIF